MDPKRLVADGYDRLYDTYANWAAADHSGKRRAMIDRAIELDAPHGGRALDLGCGTGRHATAHLVERGFDVVGVDLSRASLATAAHEVPEATFVLGDMAELGLAARSFDLIAAFYSIIHVPREEHGVVLAAIRGWLKPGGLAAIVMNGSDRDSIGVDDAWLGVAPMYWSNWRATTNRRLITEAGLELVEDSIEVQVEDDTEVSFLWTIARRSR